MPMPSQQTQNVISKWHFIYETFYYFNQTDRKMISESKYLNILVPESMVLWLLMLLYSADNQESLIKNQILVATRRECFFVNQDKNWRFFYNNITHSYYMAIVNLNSTRCWIAFGSKEEIKFFTISKINRIRSKVKIYLVWNL